MVKSISFDWLSARNVARMEKSEGNPSGKRWAVGMLATCVKKNDLMLELWSLCFDEKNCAHKRSRSQFFITARIHRNLRAIFFLVKAQEAIKKLNNFTIFSTSTFSELALKGKGNGSSKSIQICIARKPQIFAIKVFAIWFSTLVN